MTSKTDDFEAALHSKLVEKGKGKTRFVEQFAGYPAGFREGARWAAKWKDDCAKKAAIELTKWVADEARSQTLADVRKAWEEAKTEARYQLRKMGRKPISNCDLFLARVSIFERKLKAIGAQDAPVPISRKGNRGLQNENAETGASAAQKKVE